MRKWLLTSALVMAALLGVWQATYPGPNDPKCIHYVLWKWHLLPLNLHRAVSIMINDPDRDSMLLDKTEEQLRRRFGYLLPAQQVWGCDVKQFNRAIPKADTVFTLRRSDLLIVFHHGVSSQVFYVDEGDACLPESERNLYPNGVPVRTLDSATVPKSEGQELSDFNQHAVMERLRPVLRKARLTARIEYLSDCTTMSGWAAPFPKVDLAGATPHYAGLAAVQELFRTDRDITVVAKGSGSVVIRMGRVPQALLSTTIKAVRLTPTEQFNPQQAITAIEAAPEIRARLKELGLKLPLTFDFRRPVAPGPDRPHLPAELRSLTLRQALGMVSSFFGGVTIYGQCDPHSNIGVVWMGFSALNGPGRTH